jgi:hypothetical protein
MWKLDIGFQKNKTDGTSKIQKVQEKYVEKKSYTSRMTQVKTLGTSDSTILDPSTKRRMLMENIYTNVNKILEDRKLN